MLEEWARTRRAPRHAAWDAREGTGAVAAALLASDPVMLKTYTWPRYQAREPPELGADAVRRVPLVIVGAGPVGLSAAIDAALRGLPVVLARRRQHGLDRLARRLLRQADAGNLRPSGSRRPCRRQGRDLECRTHFSPRPRGLQLQPGCPRPAPPPRMVNLQQYHLASELPWPMSLRVRRALGQRSNLGAGQH